MTIRDIVEQAFFYARTCRSLWVFGFFVGLASSGSNGGGRSGGGGHAEGAAALGGVFGLFATEIAIVLVVAALVAVVVGLLLRYLSEGALIEGVARARQGAPLTTMEGLRAGWSHWGVLLRIGILYAAAFIGSLALLAVPCLLAFRAFGPVGGLVTGIPALIVAIPWLITLSLVQAFASRIAVLEDRRALDAIGKARLFLHRRLGHGLKLMVADFLGTLAIAVVGIVVVAPVVLLLAASALVVPVVAVIAVGVALLVPVFVVLTAVLGTFRSSVWTIGYVTQVEA